MYLIHWYHDAVTLYANIVSYSYTGLSFEMKIIIEIHSNLFCLSTCDIYTYHIFRQAFRKFKVQCPMCDTVVNWVISWIQDTITWTNEPSNPCWRHQMKTFSALYWPFVRGIHRSPVNYPHKGQWLRVWCFVWSAPWTNGWVNNREAGDLIRHRAHYDIIVMLNVILGPGNGMSLANIQPQLHV